MKSALLVVLLAGCAHDARYPTRISDGDVDIADPLAADDHLDLGRALALGGDLEGAGRELRIAAAEAPDDPRPDRYLGDALLRADRLEEAERAYRRSIARRETPEALNNLAIALLDRGAAAEARERALRALGLANAELRPHIEDTILRANRAAAEPEAPVAIRHPTLSAATFAYGGRVFEVSDQFLAVVDGVEPAREAARKARSLHLGGRGTMVAGGCLLGTGLTLAFTNDNRWIGGSLLGGGALLIGIGAELEHLADRELDQAAALFNARVRTLVLPLAVGEF